MYMSDEAYKSYKKPVALFLGYIIGMIGCLWGLEYFRDVLIAYDFVVTLTLDEVFRVVAFLVAYIFLGPFVFWLLTGMFGYKSSVIYRGIGFFRFVNTITIVFPVAFAGYVLFLNITDGVVQFDTFFEMVAKIAWHFFPVYIRFTYYGDTHIEKCKRCGLINTMHYDSSFVQQTGAWTESRIVYDPRYNFAVAMDDEHYEEYEKRTTRVCSECGNSKNDYFKYEKRV